MICNLIHLYLYMLIVKYLLIFKKTPVVLFELLFFFSSKYQYQCMLLTFPLHSFDKR